MRFLLVIIIASGLSMTNCTSHGKVKEFDGLEIHYTDGVTEDDVDNLGNYLESKEFTDGKLKSMQLSKVDSNLVLKIVVDNTILSNDSIIGTLCEFRNKVRISCFDSDKLIVHLTDPYFNTQKVLE